MNVRIGIIIAALFVSLPMSAAAQTSPTPGGTTPATSRRSTDRCTARVMRSRSRRW